MHVIELAQLADAEGRLEADVEGAPYGANISVILVSTDVEGAGPALHQHPYPETFVIHTGRANFTVGDKTLIGRGGQIIVVPGFTPHKFAKTGPDRLEMTNIHENGTFITEWLEPERQQ
ncbi:MAG TPA: cupin domain-containing protein [Ktedonobacterales bacterium]|jgi:mannose-6-phosphate isomerase-like protein (cupin superfamily)|nr:cupin domain-containing protein [Ktedonobacterales bacterium]